AIGAMHLRAGHKQRRIFLGAEGTGQEIVKARPAGLALELGRGVEQRLPAARTGKNAGAVLLEQRRGERALGRLVPQHVIGGAVEPRPPFGVAERKGEAFLPGGFDPRGGTAERGGREGGRGGTGGEEITA